MIDALDPRRTALLLMDYQQGILDRLSDGNDLVERAAGAVATARAAGATVGYVRVALTDDETAAVPPTNKIFSTLRHAGRTLRDDEAATAIPARIAPADGDIVVRKIRVGAFSTTDLDRRLRERGVDTLVLGGVATSGVVLSTVRDAADRDYRLVVLSDLCADGDSDVHAVLTERVFPRQADVTTCEEWGRLLAQV